MHDPRRFIAPPGKLWTALKLATIFIMAHSVGRAWAIDHDKPCGEPYELGGKRLVFTNWLFIRPGQVDWLSPEGKSVYGSSHFSAGPGDAHFADYDAPFGIQLMAEPAVIRGPVISRNEPWDQMGLRINCIMHDGDKFRAWGSSQDEAGNKFNPYFQSTDGIHWTEPNLGIVEYNGSKNNNLIDYTIGSVFKDTNPDAPASERYKSVAEGSVDAKRFEEYHKKWPTSVLATEADPGRYHAILGAVSPDGIRWTELAEPLSIEHSDTQMVVTWESAKRYVMYTRTQMAGVRADGYSFATTRRSAFVLRRAMGRSESADFRHFPLSTLIVEPGDEMPPTDTYYTNAFTRIPRAPEERVMFPATYHESIDSTSVDLFSSVDGRAWHRVPGSPIISPGTFEQWNGGCIFASPDLQELPDGTWALPFTGYRYPHKYPRGAWSYDFGLATWPKGRLVGVEAAEMGSFCTVAFLLPGKRMRINAVTKRAGGIRVEVADLLGKAIAGRSFDDSVELSGDQYRTMVHWKNGDDLGVELGKPVELRFAMERAKIYGLDFE